VVDSSSFGLKRAKIAPLRLNAHHEPIAFRLPGSAADPAWELELDTAAENPTIPAGRTFDAGARFELQGRSVAVLRQPMAE
jgi:isoamylase